MLINSAVCQLLFRSYRKRVEMLTTRTIENRSSFGSLIYIIVFYGHLQYVDFDRVFLLILLQQLKQQAQTLKTTMAPTIQPAIPFTLISK